jgi:hypothetical protein
MFVELVFLERGKQLCRGMISCRSGERTKSFSVANGLEFAVAHRPENSACALTIVCKRSGDPLYEASLRIGADTSEDWKSVELSATHTLTFRKKPDSTDKLLAASPSQIEELVPNMGACFASDRITVDGARVRYMYRAEPEFPEDSGWRFFADDEAADDPYSHAIHDVNTIANCDRTIISLLDAPPGSRFVRHPETGKLVPGSTPPPAA